MKKRECTKPEIKVMAAIYSATDCSNTVYDWATLHYRQEQIAERLESRGLVHHCDGVVAVDGDGFIRMPERYGIGWRLTNAGYEALTTADPAAYPASAKYRRFFVKPSPKRGAKR